MGTREIIAGLLMVSVFAVYFPIHDHAFVGYDDVPYIVENPTLRDGLSASGLWRTFSQPEHANWIPLTSLSLQLNYSVHGLSPAGYLLTNVALHAITSVLLFLLLRSLTGSSWRSGFVAGVFALHPLHVESVAWASQRKDVLCAFFFVLSLFAYWRFVQRRTLSNYALLLWCLVAALLSKPMAVTLPFVMLLLDYWPLGRLQGDPAKAWPDARILAGAVVEKLPLMVLAAFAAVVAFYAQGEAGNFSYASDLSFETRLSNIVGAYVAYLADSFWPSGLAIFYPIPIDPPARWWVAGASMWLLALTALAFRCAARRPYLVVGWLWFVGMLVPVVGLVQVGMQARADRYMYLPLVGIAIAFSWGAVDLYRSRFASRLASWRYGRSTGMTLAAIALMVLGVCSSRQLSHWRDSIALFGRAVAVTRDNHLAHYNLGTALGQAGRIEEALAQQEVAQQIMLRAEVARQKRRAGGS